ncbi:hypothetical protein BH708_10575 [Brachybacterium sp. P6-10-X1]|uniref:hypothetical protein n=1 Tax=Brachybacterium sp. P6-10-X1 TaxID=1903186 RepID=UPI00097193D1|nr:hypothetical protein [Brachybacterium sp. P6-10-X1]APX33083.1 hypothetical protein BH708_10575 [Brachybacterium sp. P6-10-X1]
MSDDLAYRFGFLCVTRGRAPEAVTQWHRLDLVGQDLFVHPESTVQSVATERGDTAIVVGDIFVAHGVSPLDELLLSIADGDRRPLEDLSGRFALFVVTAGEIVVLHDPLGSQALFYARSGGIAGSHAALVAETLGVAQSRRVRQYMALPEYKARKTRFLPGDLTLFDEVALLPPNNELHLRGARTSRYWPIHPVKDSSREEAFAIWDEYFTNYARFLAPRYSPVLGLTGGTDSRSVIASLHSKGIELRCETWDSMPIQERERIDPMVAHLRVNHRWLDLSHRVDSTRFHELRSAAKKAAGFTRGTPLLPALMDDRAGARDVFLYGHGSGVMRGSYSRLFKPWLPEDPLKRHYALYAGPNRKDASRAYETFTLEALRNFLNRANYGSELHGADIGDLFYWEQRMANWAALQIATFSVTMQSHAALNSRRLFSTFWGIPGEARSTKELNKDVMRHYDPVLAEL